MGLTWSAGVLAGHPGISFRMRLLWYAHSLSPLPQFGNSGGPLVNLVSPAACPLAGRGRDVLFAPCPSVRVLVGAGMLPGGRRAKPGMRTRCSMRQLDAGGDEVWLVLAGQRQGLHGLIL